MSDYCKCPKCRETKDSFYFRRYIKAQGCFGRVNNVCNRCTLWRILGKGNSLTPAMSLSYGYVIGGAVLVDHPEHSLQRERSQAKAKAAHDAKGVKMRARQLAARAKDDEAAARAERYAAEGLKTLAYLAQREAEAAAVSEAKRKAYWDKYRAKLEAKQLKEMLK